MGTIAAFPVLFILILLQTTIFRQITLLNGTTDLILLWLAAWSLQGKVKSSWFWAILSIVCISFISAIPWYVPMVSYLFVTLFARLLNKKVWQSPIMMMFLVTLLGSIVIYLGSFLSMIVSGISIQWDTALVNVIIPSIMLNLLFSLPVFAVAKDVANWAYPLEVNE